MCMTRLKDNLKQEVNCYLKQSFELLLLCLLDKENAIWEEEYKNQIPQGCTRPINPHARMQLILKLIIFNLFTGYNKHICVANQSIG